MFQVAGDEAFGTETMQHNRDDALTKITPVDYAPLAPAPTWDRFLIDIFPDADVRAFVQRAVGYSITGSTTEQVFFIGYGTGSNGKSTFLSTLQHTLGPNYAETALPQTFLAGRDDNMRSDIAALRGVRLLAVIETGDGKRLAEDLVKAVTGGDRIRCRFLYREFFEYLPSFKLWLATNHRPRITGTDHAIWRRVLLIPFTTTIPDDKVDANLPAKLQKEAEGILAWAVQGFRDYCKIGLKPPEAVRVATSKYRNDEDRVGAFLEECCTVGANLQVGKGEMHDYYKRWCEGSGEFALSQRKLSTYLTDHGFDEYRTTGGKRCWIGVGLCDGGNYE
jgi:putative DNA primase/helicase